MLGLGNSISRSSVSEAGASALRLVSPLLLDTYSGAVAAYSLRKLSSDYSGKAIQIRRASDNVEVDVSFDSSGAVSLDSAVTNVTEETTGSSTSLVTSATNLGQFVANASYTDADSLGSADSALVQCWYDQSGSGNHATQDTAGSQPQIVSSGAVITENGKPAVEFDGSNDVMSVDFQGNTNSAMMACLVLRQDSTSSLNGALGGDGSNIMDLFTDYGGTIYYDNGNRASNRLGVATPATWEDNQHLATFYATTTNQFINVDGTQIATKSGLTSVTASYKLLGATSVGNAFFGGAIQEVIVYPSDESDNRTGIETSINTFYNIYS